MLPCHAAPQAPRLASVYTIGESVLGEPLQVLRWRQGPGTAPRVTAGADRERVAGRPRVRLVANMHGGSSGYYGGQLCLSHIGFCEKCETVVCQVTR